MKTLRFSLVLFLSLMAVYSFASPGVKVHPKVLKAQKAVENASPDDWYTLAKSARVCITIGQNLKEASKWIDRSLKIYESDYNWEVKGDYYYRSNMPEKAIECYSQSIKVGLNKVPGFNARKLQEKILVLRSPKHFYKQRRVFSYIKK
ncbi:MAG: hypothetical protein MI784_01030 [Cytophagales bacterium]|nr:hypothetical protein [Cytophagales bacterium]